MIHEWLVQETLSFAAPGINNKDVDMEFVPISGQFDY